MPKFDLKERTSNFGKSIISLVSNAVKNEVTRPLISQVVRSATSIGANYMEADGAESKKDFIHKISLCKKESKETMHWLDMFSATNSIDKNELRKLWREAHELTLIFSSIINKTKNKI